ncbi:MAG TPA: hypothetical protein PKD85_20920, partial [Saprospiraceae bacterium]|nr:hypothetical protein [Saprospiraceae bacterium]
MSNINQITVSEYMDRFVSLYKLYESGLNGHRNEPISVLRREGFNLLTKEDFPTRRDEDWKYTSVTPIINQKFIEAPKIAIETKNEVSFETYRIQLNNGYLANTLPIIEGVEILLLADALKNQDYASWIHGQMGKGSGTLKNTFLPLNQAFGSQGIFIKVKRNISIEIPFLIQYNSANDDQNTPFFTSPQLFIWMEGGSNASIIEEYASDNTDSVYFTNTANR